MFLPTASVILALSVQGSPSVVMARGTAAVTQPTSDAGDAPPAFADAVQAALGDFGFTLIDGAAHARTVATLQVTRTVSGATRIKGKSPAAYPGGGTTFGNGVGAGVTIPFGAGATIGQIVATELRLRIVRRGASGPAWEGRAITHRVAGSPGDDPAILAKTLASAILRNLDGPSGVLVSVP